MQVSAVSPAVVQTKRQKHRKQEPNNIRPFRRNNKIAIKHSAIIMASSHIPCYIVSSFSFYLNTMPYVMYAATQDRK